MVALSHEDACWQFKRDEVQLVPKHRALPQQCCSPVAAPCWILQYFASINVGSIGSYLFSCCLSKSWVRVPFRPVTNKWQTHCEEGVLSDTYGTDYRVAPTKDNKHTSPSNRFLHVLLAWLHWGNPSFPGAEWGFSALGRNWRAGRQQAPLLQLMQKRSCLHTQGTNKGNIFQTILM